MAKVTRESLKGLPRKQLIKTAKSLDIATEGMSDDELIAAIIEESEETGKALVVSQEIPEPGSMNMVDLNKLTLEDLETMRPDLLKEIVDVFLERNKGAIIPGTLTNSEGKELAAKGKFEVSIGPIGPRVVEAFSEPDAVQVFMSESGCTGFNGVRPKVRRVG